MTNQGLGFPTQVCGLYASYCCYGEGNAPVNSTIPDGQWPPGPFPIPVQILDDKSAAPELTNQQAVPAPGKQPPSFWLAGFMFEIPP